MLLLLGRKISTNDLGELCSCKLVHTDYVHDSPSDLGCGGSDAQMSEPDLVQVLV